MCFLVLRNSTFFRSLFKYGYTLSVINDLITLKIFALVFILATFIAVYWKLKRAKPLKKMKVILKNIAVVGLIVGLGITTGYAVNREDGQNILDPEGDYQELMDALRKYGLLPSSASLNAACFILVKMTKEEIFTNDNVPIVSMGIRLEFQKMVTDKKERANSVDKGQSLHGIRNQFDKHPSKVMIGNCDNYSIGKKIKDDGLEMANLKQDNLTVAKIDDKDGTRNETVVAYAKPPEKDIDKESGDSEEGFGRTQVVVIATCSAVVGTFFIIAGVMRIHGCVKRYRVNRQFVLDVAGRSSTGNLNGDTFARRPSGESKTSRQNKHSTNEESEEDEKTQLFPAHAQCEQQNDATFLLPVSDELLPVSCQDVGDMNNSHNSFAFIDENVSCELGRDCARPGYRKEYDPLLPESERANERPVDVALENDDTNKDQNEYMTSVVDNMTSPQNADVESSLNQRRTSCSESLASLQGNNVATLAKQEPKVEFQCRSLARNEINGGDSDSDAMIKNVTSGNPEDLMKSEEYVRPENICNRKQSFDSAKDKTEGSEQPSLVNLSRGLSTDSSEYDFDTGFPIYKRKSSASRQYSVDYFEVDENGIEIYNPIFEEDENEQLNEATTPPPIFNGLVTTGFHQSDNSLNENPSYCYGNQVEYGVNGDYNPQYYFSYCHHGNDTEFDLINRCACAPATFASQKPKSYSACEPVMMKELSLFHEPGEDLSKTRVSRMLSSDSYFRNKSRSRTNAIGVSVDQTDNILAISSQSSVRSEIVPLSIYKRNSLKEGRRFSRDNSDNNF